MSNRFLKDAELIKSKALPAAAATAYTASIDLGAVALGPTGDHIEAEISVPATPALVEDKTITLNFQESDDDTTFANIGELESLVITGGAGNGASAASRIVRLPRATKRYIRAAATVLADGGDNTGVDFSLALIG